ncbi:MAG: ribonuclease HI family protein [candidate division WOR-3 bacterium]
MNGKETYLVQIDGSSRCNPGPAGIGIRIIDPEGKVVKEISRFIGKRTNNQAEYEALITALNEIRLIGRHNYVIHTDSELLYNQLQGRYKVRNQQLKELHAQAKRLLSLLPNVTIRLVPRTENRLSDRLAKSASHTS